MISYQLNEVCSRIKSGKGISASRIKQTGEFPVIGGNGIRGYTSTFNFEGECAVVGRQGAACGNVRYFSGKAYMTEHAVVVQANSNHNTRYLAYLLSIMNLGRLSAQSAQPGLSVRMLARQIVELPSLSVQNRSAKLLGDLDKKISLNQRTNDYLATLVDLEFSKRFSGSVSTTSLKNVLEISTKSLKPQQHAGETWEHYSIPAFDEMHWPIFELADGIKSNKYIVDRSSILISKLNPSIKRMWIQACLTNKAVCSTEFIVYKPLEPRHKSFYCAAINAASFTAFLLEHVTGSTGSRQRAQPKATLDYPMPSPCRTAIEAFCDFADPIYRQIELNGIESQRLGSLRDALLPKLMSGEIDVSQVEVPMLPNNHLYVD